MKKGQVLARRERDLNSPKQFARSVGVSAVAHLALLLMLFLFSQWSFKPNAIVPSPYVVKIVTPDQLKPRSLLEQKKKKRKPPAPKVKKTSKHKKKKAKPRAKKKKISKAKKIVPITKEKPKKKPKKKAPPQKKEKPLPEKKPAPKEQPRQEPQKTMVTDGEYFPHIWYLKIVEKKVNENWVTHGIDITGKRADPVVSFRVARDGSVYGIKLERSSGSAALDQSAVEAVENASPFPPLPEDFKGDSLGVHFGFDYEQRN